MGLLNYFERPRRPLRLARIWTMEWWRLWSWTLLRLRLLLEEARLGLQKVQCCYWRFDPVKKCSKVTVGKDGLLSHTRKFPTLKSAEMAAETAEKLTSKGWKVLKRKSLKFFSRRQYNKGMTSFFMYLKNPFGVWHGIAYDEAGKSDIGSRLWKNDGLRHLDVRLASEILGIHVLPKFVGQPFWFSARGRIRIEATKYHPIPEVLQVTITVPRIAVQLCK